MNRLLTQGRLAYLGALIVLTCLFARQAWNLQVEQSNQSMGTTDPAVRLRYERFKQRYGNDESIILTISSRDGIGAGQMALLDRLSEEIQQWDGVYHVDSLSLLKSGDAASIVTGRVPAIPKPYRDVSVRKNLDTCLRDNPLLRGWLISRDKKTAAVIVQLEVRSGDDLYRQTIIHRLRSLMRTHAREDTELHLAGIAVVHNDIAELIQHDQKIYIPLTALVCGVLLFALFGSIHGVVLPLATAGISLIWTLGIYAALGFSLNTITSLLPPVIMILSIATAVHIYHDFQENLSTGSSRLDAVLSAVRRLKIPCFFTSFTTAIGLSVLSMNQIPAVRYFGVFSAMGVMLSFCIGMTLVPVALSWLKIPGGNAGSQRTCVRMDRMIGRLSTISIHHPRLVLLLAAVSSVIALFGARRIRNDTDLIRFLEKDAPLYVDTMFVDQHLTGVNSLELVITRSDGLPLHTLEDLKRFDAFQKRVHRFRHVTGIRSFSDLIKQIHQHVAPHAVPALPDSEDTLALCLSALQLPGLQHERRNFVAADLTEARMSIRVHAVGSHDANALIDRILQTAAEVFGSRYHYAMTGNLHRVVTESNRLVAEQMKSFLAALILILASIGLLFRSFKMLLVAAIPNIIPIVWLAGIMGYCHIPLSTGTAMISCVVIGLCVDDTIHYLHRFVHEHTGGYAGALAATTRHTGKALVITSIVLAFGFWVGCFGSFKPTVYFSLFTGVTILGALLCDLMVLPACIVMMQPLGREGRGLHKR